MRLQPTRRGVERARPLLVADLRELTMYRLATTCPFRSRQPQRARGQPARSPRLASIGPPRRHETAGTVHDSSCPFGVRRGPRQTAPECYGTTYVRANSTDDRSVSCQGERTRATIAADRRAASPRQPRRGRTTRSSSPPPLLGWRSARRRACRSAPDRHSASAALKLGGDGIRSAPQTVRHTPMS